jgi:hypothetical protein
LVFGFWILLAVVAAAAYAAFLGNSLRLLTPDQAANPGLKLAVKMLGIMLPLAAAGLAGVFYSNERAVICDRLAHGSKLYTKRWSRLAAAAQRIRTTAIATQSAMLSLVALADANPSANAGPSSGSYMATTDRVEELVGSIPFIPIPIPSCLASSDVSFAYRQHNRLLADLFETMMLKRIGRHRGDSQPVQLQLPLDGSADLDEEMRTLVASAPVTGSS